MEKHLWWPLKSRSIIFRTSCNIVIIQLPLLLASPSCLSRLIRPSASNLPSPPRMLTSIKLIFGRMNYYVTIGRFGFTIYLRPVGVNKIRFQNRTTAHRRALFTGCRNPLDQQNDLQPFLIQNWLGEWENSVFWTKRLPNGHVSYKSFTWNAANTSVFCWSRYPKIDACKHKML